MFYGHDLVTFLVEEGLAEDRDEAVLEGKHFMLAGLFKRVGQSCWLEDDQSLYRLTSTAAKDEEAESL